MSELIFRILSVGFLASASDTFYSKFLSGISTGMTLAYFILNLLLCFAGGWKLGALLHAILVNPLPKDTRKLTAWQLRPQLLCEATTFNAALLDTRLLVLRGVDDEAAMSLAIGAVANRILRLLYDFMVTPAVHFVFLACFVSLFVFVSSVSPFVFYGQYLIFGIAAFALAAPSIIRPVFGRELAFGALRCDATYESAPDSHSATIETLPSETSKSKRTVHAIYDNSFAPAAIANWLVREGRSSTLSG